MEAEQIVVEARRAADGMSALARAEFMSEIARAVYDAEKFSTSDGGGFDGRDTAERESLAVVVDAAVDAVDRLRGV